MSTRSMKPPVLVQNTRSRSCQGAPAWICSCSHWARRRRRASITSGGTAKSRSLFLVLGHPWRSVPFSSILARRANTARSSEVHVFPGEPGELARTKPAGKTEPDHGLIRMRKFLRLRDEPVGFLGGEALDPALGTVPTGRGLGGGVGDLGGLGGVAIHEPPATRTAKRCRDSRPGCSDGVRRVPLCFDQTPDPLQVPWTEVGEGDPPDVRDHPLLERPPVVGDRVRRASGGGQLGEPRLGAGSWPVVVLGHSRPEHCQLVHDLGLVPARHPLVATLAVWSDAQDDLGQPEAMDAVEEHSPLALDSPSLDGLPGALPWLAGLRGSTGSRHDGLLPQGSFEGQHV